MSEHSPYPPDVLPGHIPPSRGVGGSLPVTQGKKQGPPTPDMARVHVISGAGRAVQLWILSDPAPRRTHLGLHVAPAEGSWWRLAQQWCSVLRTELRRRLFLLQEAASSGQNASCELETRIYAELLPLGDTG